MDKFEYQAKLEELNKLVEKENYEEAAALADTIEWKRVRSVRTLCMVSEIYEAVGRVEDSKSILYRAYRRSPNSRQILYRLTEVCVQTQEFDDAVEYYTEYVNLAPNDNNKYILKYEIYKGRGSSIEEQIQVLEELKNKEYTEQWACELARLYDKAGMADKCVETCDDLALWFHNGQYVVQALELKKKYAPLTPEQQTIYDNPSGIVDMETKEAAIEAAVPTLDEEITKELPRSETEVIADSILMDTEKEIAAVVSEHKEEQAAKKQTEGAEKPQQAREFDTVGLQNELAQSMRQILAGMKPAKRVEVGELERIPALESVAAAREQEPDDEIEGQMSLEDFLTENGEARMPVSESGSGERYAPASESGSRNAGAAVSGTENREAPVSENGTRPMPGEEPVQPDEEENDILTAPTIDISKRIRKETGGQDLRSYAAQQAMKAGAAVQETPEVQTARQSQPTRAAVQETPEVQAARQSQPTRTVVQETPEVQAARQFQPTRTVVQETPEVQTARQSQPTRTVVQETPEVQAARQSQPTRAAVQETPEVQTARQSQPTRAAVQETPEVQAARQTQPTRAAVQETPEVQTVRQSQPTRTIAQGTPTAQAVSQPEPAEKLTWEAPTAPQLQPQPARTIPQETPSVQPAPQPQPIRTTVQETPAVQPTPQSQLVRTTAQETPAVQPTPQPQPIQEEEVPRKDTEDQLLQSRQAEPSEPEEEQGSQSGETAETETAQAFADPMSYIHNGLDEKEKSMLGFWSTIRGMNEQVNAAVTQIMRGILADKTSSRGNVILVGDAGNGRTTLAVSIAKILSRCRGLQSAKVAKIYAEDLNSKDIAATVSKISGGVLIIEEAGDLSDAAIAQLSMAMEFRTDGMVVFLEDERRYLQDLLARNPQFAQKFDITLNVPMLTNDELVEFGKYYALQNDCVLDDSAVLALYDGIGAMQTPDQPVAILDVKEVMDKAIRRANKFGIGKIFSTISGKRYDEEDRIIIKAKNFKKIK